MTTDEGLTRFQGAPMTSHADTSPGVPERRWLLGKRRVRGVLVLLMGCLAIVAPFLAGPLALFLVGVLLIVCGVLEMLESFRAPDSSLRSTYLGGGLSILAGILLLNEPEMMLKGVSVVLAVSFLLDGVGKGIAALRARWAGT